MNKWKSNGVTLRPIYFTLCCPQIRVFYWLRFVWSHFDYHLTNPEWWFLGRVSVCTGLRDWMRIHTNLWFEGCIQTSVVVTFWLTRRIWSIAGPQNVKSLLASFIYTHTHTHRNLFVCVLVCHVTFWAKRLLGSCIRLEISCFRLNVDHLFVFVRKAFSEIWNFYFWTEHNSDSVLINSYFSDSSFWGF